MNRALDKSKFRVEYVAVGSGEVVGTLNAQEFVDNMRAMERDAVLRGKAPPPIRFNNVFCNSEEALPLPTMDFPDRCQTPLGPSGGFGSGGSDDGPLVAPVMDFSGQREAAEGEEQEAGTHDGPLVMPTMNFEEN